MDGSRAPGGSALSGHESPDRRMRLAQPLVLCFDSYLFLVLDSLLLLFCLSSFLWDLFLIPSPITMHIECIILNYLLIFTILTPVTHKSCGLDIPSLRGLPGLGVSPRLRSRLEPGHRHVRPGCPGVATRAPRREGVANPTGQE